jgi:hypothetical protein
MRLASLVAVATFLLHLSPALGDTWRPFQDKRAVSPSGRTYVVVRLQEEDESIRFELCLRRAGAPPMKPAVARDRFGLEKGRGGSIDRDPKDEVLARGTVSQIPYEVKVADEPAGFAVFEQWGGIGHEKAVIWVGKDGKPRFAKELDDLFDIECQDFMVSVSSIWWPEGFWIDEERRRIVTVAKGDHLREVSLEDGKVTTPKSEVLLRRFRVGLESERELALEVASRLLPEGAGPEARTLARDEGHPLGIRLRAALTARRAGVRESFATLFVKASTSERPLPVRGYAAKHLPEVLGDAAMPVLREMLRAETDFEVRDPAWRSLASFGRKAEDLLIEMLREKEAADLYRAAAASALFEIKSKKAVDDLLDAAATGGRDLCYPALIAAMNIGAPDLGPRLAKILEAGCEDDSTIAVWFRDHPQKDAIPALEKARERTEPDTYQREYIDTALAACRKLPR